MIEDTGGAMLTAAEERARLVRLCARLTGDWGAADTLRILSVHQR